MRSTVAAEHFTLTPSIRSHVAQSIEKIERHLGPDASVHVFAKRLAKGRFAALYQTLWNGQDWIAEVESEDLYAALTAASDKLCRSIDRDKRRKRRERRVA